MTMQKLRVQVTAGVDLETAEALEREARERKIRLAPLVRQVLEEHTAKQRQSVKKP